MAGVVGGATGAALAAIVMIFEMTLDYNVIIPMTITVALAYGVRKGLSTESIYTLKLVRRGHYMPEALQSNFHQMRRASEVMDTHFGFARAETSLEAFARTILADPKVTWCPVTNGDNVMGVASKDLALLAFGETGGESTLGEVAVRHFVAVTPSSTITDVAGAFRAGGAAVALVTRTGRLGSERDVIGVISGRQMGEVLSDSFELFGSA